MNTAADKHCLFSEVKKSLPSQIFPFCFIGIFSATQASLIILSTLLFWRHTGYYYLTLNPAYPIGYLFLKARKRGILNHTVGRGPSACFGMKRAFLGYISTQKSAPFGLFICCIGCCSPAGRHFKDLTAGTQSLCVHLSSQKRPVTEALFICSPQALQHKRSVPSPRPFGDVQGLPRCL